MRGIGILSLFEPRIDAGTTEDCSTGITVFGISGYA